MLSVTLELNVSVHHSAAPQQLCIAPRGYERVRERDRESQKTIERWGDRMREIAEER